MTHASRFHRLTRLLALGALASASAAATLTVAACSNDDSGDGGNASGDATADARASDATLGLPDGNGDGGVFDGGDATIADAGPLDASTRDTGVPAHFSPTTVACIGDSITQGVGASGPTTNWVADLGGLLGKSVAVGNFGVSGTTMLKASNSSYWTTGELPKAEAFAGANDAGTGAAVIIMLGTNDSKDVDGGVDNWNASAPARYRTDYNAMIDALLDVNDAGGAGAASAPKPLVFLALPPPATDTNGYDISGTVIAQQIIPIIVDIAYQRGLPVIDVHTALAGYTADFPDGVHPNDAGHALVAKAMQAGLLSPHVPSTPDGG